MTALSALQRPSFDAAVPRTVPRDQLAAAAGLLVLPGDAGEEVADELHAARAAAAVAAAGSASSIRRRAGRLLSRCIRVVMTSCPMYGVFVSPG